MNGVCVAAIVRGVGRKVAKPNSDREENLPTGRLPYGAACELVSVPLGEIHSDAVDRVWKRHAAADENDDHDNRQAHGDVDDAPRQAHAPEHAEPDEEPHESTPPDRLADKARARILRVARHRAAAGISGDWIHVSNGILHVKLLSAPSPRQWAREGRPEVAQHPAQDGYVVCRDDEPVHDDSETHALGVPVNAVERHDDTSAVSLADGDFEDQDGYAEKE